jgi:hypothetical protein
MFGVIISCNALYIFRKKKERRGIENMTKIVDFCTDPRILVLRFYSCGLGKRLSNARLAVEGTGAKKVGSKSPINRHNGHLLSARNSENIRWITLQTTR